MSEKTAIEWTDATWNPLRVGPHAWYCEKISPGCDNCYASRLNRRFGSGEYPRAGQGGAAPGGFGLLPGADEPLRWKKPRRVFVCSMTDLFGEWVTEYQIACIFHVMAQAHHHTYQVLTKRPKRMAEAIAKMERPFRESGYPWPLTNVWLGVSVEEDRYAWRARILADIPAAVRFVSAEPLLGPLPSLPLECPTCGGRGVDPAICRDHGCDHAPEDWCHRCDGKGRLIDWLIVGGESGGPAERRLVERCPGCDEGFPGQHGYPCLGWQPQAEKVPWVRDLRDRANAAGTAFFFKQWGGPTPKAGGRLLGGRTWDEMPATSREGVLV